MKVRRTLSPAVKPFTRARDECRRKRYLQGSMQGQDTDQIKPCPSDYGEHSLSASAIARARSCRAVPATKIARLDAGSSGTPSLDERILISASTQLTGRTPTASPARIADRRLEKLLARICHPTAAPGASQRQSRHPDCSCGNQPGPLQGLNRDSRPEYPSSNDRITASRTDGPSDLIR